MSLDCIAELLGCGRASGRTADGKGGGARAHLGEEVAAAVVVREDVDVAELADQLRNTVASFAVPTRWYLQRDPFPVVDTGKTDKKSIKAQCLQSGAWQ